MAKKKFPIYIIIIFLILAIIVIFGNRFAITGETKFETNALGDKVEILSPTFSFFQPFSFYGTKSCFVDDENSVGCISGSTQTTRDFGVLGWSSYGSCAGWMTYWGCDPNDCNLVNGATGCFGSSEDSKVECSYDSDCREKYKDIYPDIYQYYYCNGYGQCQLSEFGTTETCDYKYRCQNGAIHKCYNGQWTLYGSCIYVYGINVCEKMYGDSIEEVCKKQCTSDLDCPSGEVCISGVCTEELAQEIIEQQQEYKESQDQSYLGTFSTLNSECTSDSDCEYFEMCSNNICILNPDKITEINQSQIEQNIKLGKCGLENQFCCAEKPRCGKNLYCASNGICKPTFLSKYWWTLIIFGMIIILILLIIRRRR